MRTRLRHVAQINPLSHRFDRLRDDDPVPFLPMERVWPGDRLDLSERRPKSAVAVGYTRFESGDVIVPKITPTFEASRAVLVPDLPGSVAAGTTELHVVRPGPEIDPRYLLYVFHTHDFLRIGEAAMYGVAGQQRVPDGLIRDWTVDLPTLDEQRQIADFLDSDKDQTDLVVRKRADQLGLLDELALSFIDDAVSHIEVHFMVRLGYLAVVQGGITVDGNRSRDGDVVTMPYLRVANVQVGRIDLDNLMSITVPRAAAAASRLRAGDVLMTEGGDLDKLGRGALWNSEVEDCLHQNHVFAVRPDLGILVPEYLALLTRASIARDYFESTGNKTTNLASTSSSKIRDFRIPLTDTATQRFVVKEVDARLRSISEFKDRLLQQLTLLAERRQALITAAVTGRIDVTTARGAVR